MASRDLSFCVPELQEKVPLIIKDYQELYPERELRVICTLRSNIEQLQLYAIGRTIPPIGRKYWITQVDGVKTFSKHNSDPNEPLAKAVDFGVFIGGKYITNTTFYYPLLELSRKYGLVSGIDFKKSNKPLEQLLKEKSWKDFPHVETTTKYYKEK